MSAPNTADTTEVSKLDPENEINARIVLTWGVAFFGAFVFAMWLLSLVFDNRIFVERGKKTEQVGTELSATRHRNDLVLTGQQEEGFQGMTIEEAMTRLRAK